MDWDRIQQKLHILSDAAKYDVSCSSSGSRRANQAGGIGNGAVCGICHTWSADGRCVSLLKILMTNRCIYDCAYCVNAASRESERAILTPEEIADVTIAFYRRNYIEGLFLSSGVYRSPDYTTELLIRTARILRDEKKFNGYIHMKGIPGTSAQLIRELGRYVDRLSVNIELPSAPSLRLLAPQKTRENILVPMRHIRQGILERREEKKHHKKAPSFVPAGQTTQLIVGATPDSDRTILRLSQALYDKVELKRVYYSAYVPADDGKARRILDALLAQCGPKSCHYLYYAFLAEEEGRGLALLQYLRWAFRYKGGFLHHLSEEPIWTVRQWARRTGNERHKLLGLARFRELSDGMLYCQLQPTCCVVPVMAPHFVRRFPAERWALHDTGRGLGVYYDGRQPVVVTIPRAAAAPDLSADEEAIEGVWQDYYRTIAIPSRRNEALRRSYMPKKYWSSLIEMK